MAAAMGSIGTVIVAPLAVAAILLGLSSEGSATATKVALIKETMAALDIVIFSNSYRPYGFLIGIYPIWHHFDDVGLAADGELFISCNECAFLVCWTCYEYERREGSQVCPQMQTRFKQLKGCALAGRSYEDIQYMAEAMLQGHMSYGRGLMSICLKLFTQCLKSLCSPMARWLMIFLRNSTLSSLPSWVGEERGFTHFPLRIAVFQCNLVPSKNLWCLWPWKCGWKERMENWKQKQEKIAYEE